MLRIRPLSAPSGHSWPFHTLTVIILSALITSNGSAELKRIRYNNPGLHVDLGVGLWAWPLPVDFDGDGDLDLVVVCPDKPHNGTYFFENPGGGKMPVFKSPKRISVGRHDAQISYTPAGPKVMTAGRVYPDFFKTGLRDGVALQAPARTHQPIDYGRGQTRVKVRAKQWKSVDYDGDGKQDLAIGIGDWAEYGWDNAYDKQGRWTNGPLHGYIYIRRNEGTNDQPQYGEARRIMIGDKPLDVFGRPSPNFADFDGDGDLDLLCGEFIDKFTYFENIGTRKAPRYATGRHLRSGNGPLKMQLCMIAPVAIDWDGDKDLDLVVGDEDGRVALVENTGKFEKGLPEFLPPKYFQQEANEVKFGALATPVGFDWDGDGDEDIICGNTGGYIALIENLGGKPARWAAPRHLKAGGKEIHILAGPNGSIQGPCEEKWGYTTLSVGDWDHDKLPDLIVNSIWGKIEWYRNVGTRKKPRLESARPVQVAWKGKPPQPKWNWWKPRGNNLVTQWRTTPVMVDFNRDGLNDLVMLDHEGYLSFFERTKRDGRLQLLPGRRIFVDEKRKPLRFNSRDAGGSGRRKLAVVDWDGDGKLDVLANSKNADWWQNTGGGDGLVILRSRGPIDPQQLGGHTSSPTVVDWNKDGIPELLVGAEDGFLYYQPRTKR